MGRKGRFAPKGEKRSSEEEREKAAVRTKREESELQRRGEIAAKGGH